jgi:opacity protein-like surface antigen
MKKSLTVVLSVLFVLSVTNLFSQSAYVKLGGGYGLSLASQELYDAGVSPAHDYKYGSFGEGINFQAGFGYNINPNIALELAGSYTMGKKFEYTHGTTLIENIKLYANTISIMPSVVIKAPMKDMTPYTRFGMIIGIPSKIEERTETGTGAALGTNKEKESGGMGLGIQGAVGINFKAGKQLGIFAEIFGIGMNYGPSTWENTETYTGKTIIATKTYEEAWTPTAGDNKLKKPRYSFSSFGLNVGLSYTFGQ